MAKSRHSMSSTSDEVASEVLPFVGLVRSGRDMPRKGSQRHFFECEWCDKVIVSNLVHRCKKGLVLRGRFAVRAFICSYWLGVDVSNPMEGGGIECVSQHIPTLTAHLYEPRNDPLNPE